MKKPRPFPLVQLQQVLDRFPRLRRGWLGRVEQRELRRTQRWMLPFWAPLLLVLALPAGCGTMTASQTATQSVEVSGTTLIMTGDVFTHVAAAYTTGCAAKSIPQTQCEAFRAFGLKFKANYPKAASAWEVARSINDVISAQQAEATIRALTADLNAYGTAVLTVR